MQKSILDNGTNQTGYSELPSNLAIKKASPKIWLPLLTIVWGIITMCLGFVRNFAGFVAVRAILGVAEGGLLPGMVCQFALRSMVAFKASILTCVGRSCIFHLSTGVVTLRCVLACFTRRHLYLVHLVVRTTISS